MHPLYEELLVVVARLEVEAARWQLISPEELAGFPEHVRTGATSAQIAIETIRAAVAVDPLHPPENINDLINHLAVGTRALAKVGDLVLAMRQEKRSPLPN